MGQSLAKIKAFLLLALGVCVLATSISCAKSLSSTSVTTSNSNDSSINPTPTPKPTATPIASNYNVKCSCDNIADDTACIQGAINNNSTVVFASTQICNANKQILIPANKTIVGNSATLNLNIKAASPPGISMSGSLSTLSGLNINFFPEPTTHKGVAIWLDKNVAGITIIGNTLNANGAAEAIMSALTNTKNVTISKNTILNAGFGILVNSYPPNGFLKDIAVYQSGWTIEGNTMRNIHGDAIELNSPVANGGANVPDVAQNNFIVSNNDLESGGATSSSAGSCVGLAGITNSQVFNNKLNNCKWQCIHVEDYSNHILVKNNTCGGTVGPKSTDVSSWSLFDSAGIILLGSSHDIQLLSNTISNSAGVGIDLNFDAKPNGYTYNNFVSGNLIKNSGDYAIFVGGTSSENINTTVGPSNGSGGNVTSNSARHIGSVGAGNGSIQLTGAKGAIITGNSGN